ncbi:hypothetical protein LA52FAK_19200 [Desulforhopalus sp. 52FAK]
MPTPVIYSDAEVDPFKHLRDDQKSTKSEIFYVTNRGPENKKQKLSYGNTYDTSLHFGTVTVQLGHPETTWDELYNASLSIDTSSTLPITVDNITLDSSMKVNSSVKDIELTPELSDFFNKINASLAAANDKEIMLYVHGTKVDFANSVILTAEVDHFAGRDFVGIAFAWPSHQDIFHYLMRTDVKRANQSSTALRDLLLLLSKYTTAEQINLLSYSAGGKVASKALHELRQEYVELNAKELKEKLRIGSAVFAAADVQVDVFIDRIFSISEIAEQVVITISDSDNALQAAQRFMGGTYRTGSSEAEATERKFIAENKLDNVEIIDVSIGQELRGFDIVGHHYWYRHPWMSSDIIFLMRTDLPPARRGLTPADQDSIWYLPSDYPNQIRAAAKAELEGQW